MTGQGTEPDRRGQDRTGEDRTNSKCYEKTPDPLKMETNLTRYAENTCWTPRRSYAKNLKRLAKFGW